MKKRYFLMGALAVSVLCACHNHEHGEEGHDHEAELAAAEDDHDHHPDEIILTAEKAKAAGIAVETVKPGMFHQIIQTSGQVLAAQGEETTVVASAPGVVRFARTLAPGSAVRRGATLFHLSADKMEGGDPVERAYIAYQNAKAELERARPLAEKQIVSRKDLQALQAAYEDARVAYEAIDPGHARKGVAVAGPSRRRVREECGRGRGRLRGHGAGPGHPDPEPEAATAGRRVGTPLWFLGANPFGTFQDSV